MTRAPASPATLPGDTGSEWPDTTTRPSELRGSAFGSTLFDALASAPPKAPSTFDVCHVGVVLRALLFVHLVMAAGVLFVASSLASWLALASAGSAVALPGVLLWLLVACLLKHPLAALPEGAQWFAASGLGAVSGLFGWGLGWFSGLDLFSGVRWLAPVLAGAGMAAAIFHWLRLRARARLPADTTARLIELQSRIRPHFLFNTLNTALSLVRLDPARAEGVLEDLAELFRVALADSGESVTLAEEVELAKRYLAIEQIRFGRRLQVSWELDPDAGSARVPPLLLQPLVENAVRHGVEPAAEGGVIRVRTRIKLGNAVVSIANSVPDAPSRPGSGMALRNVRERLRLMHDVTAQFETRHERGMFKVQIVVPL
ncbi:sensor histidine kinase [Piscinibacter sp.]|jgi:two-component system sensor histidine kinase AlgZ|uniref:sensor histidine kinase n=1 Tax=Piscinibacter sp. TaxID=1903157 RepID=UPI002F41015F